MQIRTMGRTEITVPASTSNLGASFDTCGLALSLYLKVSVEKRGNWFEVLPTGEGSNSVPRDESNLIIRVAKSIAELRGKKLEGCSLQVESEIPLARGLGSSSAAIISGISVFEILTGDRLSEDQLLSYALRFEEHGDNLAPSLLGGLVVACEVTGRGPERGLVTVKRAWPAEVKIVLCIPEFEMDTSEMRRVLPRQVGLEDAVFNVQRAALLQAAVSERRFELISEALRDHLHQPHRVPRRPGLSEVLRMNDETRDHPGLLGVAMSGAGSTMLAFATENFSQIAGEMKRRLASAGVQSRTLEAGVDNTGRRIEMLSA